MVIQVRLDVPVQRRDNGPPLFGEADVKARQEAKAMNVQVNRVKVRDDVVQLYGSKVVSDE